MANAKSVGSISERESIDIRKIENGYILAKSSEDPKGNYKRTEVFSKEKPVIQMPKSEPAARSPNMLSSMAKSAAKRKR